MEMKQKGRGSICTTRSHEACEKLICSLVTYAA